MEKLPKFSQKLKELITKKKDIQEEKKLFVKEQNYEKAADAREREKKFMEEIYAELKVDTNQMNVISQHDIDKILNLVQEDDIDFSNAISKLEKKELERMILVRYIEQYAKGDITSEKMHRVIKQSFDVVEKEAIKNIEKRLEEKIKNLLWT